jgi:hypothetical protein
MSTTTQGAYSVSMPLSPPPPADLGSYARTMHQHTKRQMETISQSTPRSSQHSPNSLTDLPDGVPVRGRNSSQYSYQT